MDLHRRKSGLIARNPRTIRADFHEKIWRKIRRGNLTIQLFCRCLGKMWRRPRLAFLQSHKEMETHSLWHRVLRVASIVLFPRSIVLSFSSRFSRFHSSSFLNGCGLSLIRRLSAVVEKNHSRFSNVVFVMKECVFNDWNDVDGLCAVYHVVLP